MQALVLGSLRPACVGLVAMLALATDICSQMLHIDWRGDLSLVAGRTQLIGHTRQVQAAGEWTRASRTQQQRRAETGEV
jgi:hypothetical protein